MSDTPPRQTLDTKAFFDILKQGLPQESREVDATTLRYAIYARKSTTGDERQERSIPDQIRDCIDKVVNAGDKPLDISGGIIEEKFSAKTPDLRRKFRKLLDDVEDGKIDGIISWHPDRLSRNMKEAGEIIDLLDKGILKDLRFATSTFENSPTGKMLLGISFVLSKQYSEHLSESVRRGNQRKVEDGIFFDEMKHGYVINDKGQLFPDGDNFTIIREVFEKRMEGESQPAISKWLNTEQSYYRVRKKNKSAAPYTWTTAKVAKVLVDPVYAGVLKYGNSLAHLEEFYDFTPVVTVDEFLKINKIKDFSASKIVSSITSTKRDGVKGNLLRGVVYCGYCNKSLTSSLTSKVLKQHGKVRYYHYKCETEGCTFENKTVRARVILNYAFDFLNTHLFATKDTYSAYVDEAQAHIKSTTKELNSSLMSYTKMSDEKQKEYERTKALLTEHPELTDHYDLARIQKEHDELEGQITQITEQKASLKGAIVTYEQYLKLFESLGVKLSKNPEMELTDQVLRQFFSNFTVKASGVGKQRGYEITHKLKEPWDELLKIDNSICGRGERTRTFDLAVPNRAR